jgi:hypothetical protein
MNRTAYLAQPHVANFVVYLADVIRGSVPLNVSVGFSKQQLYAGFVDRFPGYPDLRDGGGPVYVVSAQSLEDLFTMYWWDGKDFRETHAVLGVVQAAIQAAIEGEQGPNRQRLAMQAAHEVMKWGFGEGRRAYRANMNWAKRQQQALGHVLRAGREALSGETPAVHLFGAERHGDKTAHGELSAPRMNAGWTKYFALALPNHIIYDGRVGAALGFLVRRFLEQLTPQERPTSVPQPLAFLWANGMGSATLRDPSGGSYRFAKLYGGHQGSKARARVNVWANWVLAAARDRAGAGWCAGQDGLRALEAALFMLGYDLSRANDARSRGVRRPAPIDAPGTPEERRQLPAVTDPHFRVRLKHARLEAGMSYTELARRAGIHAVMPSRYENDTHSNATLPSDATWKRLNDVLFAR